MPVPCNLNHPTRRGRKPRAGREVPILARGRRLGAAKVPARTRNVPILASFLLANLKECKGTSKREVKRGGRPNGFPGKVHKKAVFLWTVTYTTLPGARTSLKQEKSPNFRFRDVR